MKTKAGRRLVPLILCLSALALCLLAGCGRKDKDVPITRLEQLAEPGRKIGVGIGTGEDAAVREAFPKAEIELFNDGLMGYAAVADGSLDAFCYSKRNMELAIRNGRAGVRLLDETVGEGNRVAVGLSPKSRIPDLKGQIDAFIAGLQADGTLDDMYMRWVVALDETMPDIGVPAQSDVHLRVGTVGVVPPFSYYAGTELNGFDIELARRFAAWLGADLEFKVYDYTGLITAAQSGDVDCIMAELYVTPEREETIPFSATLFTVELGVMVRDTGAAAETAGTAKDSGGYARIEELNGKRIGVATGSIQAQQVAEFLPDAQIFYFTSDVDMLGALRANKIDAFASAEALVRYMMAANPDLTCLDGYLGSTMQVAAIFPKTEAGQALCDAFSDFIREIRSNGVYEEIQTTWFGADESKRVVPDLYQLPATRGTLRMAADTTMVPFVYVKDGKPVGVDVDMAVRFCRENGYGLEFVPMDFAGIIPSVTTGKVDFACSGIAYTAERAESVLFSEPTTESGSVLAVLKSAGAAAETAEVRWQDYNGKRLGVLVGPLMEEAAAAYFPDSEYFYFNSYPDCATALLAGRIDGFLGDEPGMISMHAENPAIDYIHESLTENNYAFAFRKDDPESAALCAELNEFLARAWADGTMNELEEIWLGVDEARKVVDMSGLTGEKGRIRVVTTSTDMPWSYIKDGKNVGYDMDLVVRFCRDRGYALELGDVDFAGRIPAVQSGKYDFSTDMNVTPEREEQVLFSDPTSHGGIVLAVRASDLGGKQTSAAETGAALVVLKDAAGQTAAAELKNAVIGVQTGTTHDELVTAQFPDAKILYYNTYADLLVALSDGKIDAFPISELTLRPMLAEHPNLQTVEGVSLMTADMGFVAGKTPEGQALCDEFSAWFAEINASGEMDAILRKWTEAPESEQTVPDWTALPAERGTLRMATEGGFPPYEYYLDGKLVGIEIDLVARFCKEKGYGLEITDMSFESVLPSVSSGKSDFAAAGIAITAVRGESLSFTEPYLTEKVVLVTLPKDAAAAQTGGFWSGVRDSFEKTFIREARWKLFVQGIGTTLLITVLSIILGTVLGFGVYLLCRGGNVVANGVTRFFVWLIHGMPMVVLLMILYYIIFGKVAISGTVVAIIGFTLVFGASVIGMLRSGVGAVDKGQTEAAYALGYSDRRAFFRVVLPQALPHFFPAYKGEITATIKATAIVGYVAVQDLTKMGDIVRSRTYEAFFPLIAVAIIYFILAGILTAIVNRLGVFIDPRRRKNEDVLKGVTVK